MPTCFYCHREYQRKVYFERHVVACQFLSKSNKERELELEEVADTPSIRDLYKIIMELAAKCNQLETQLKEVSKWAALKKQKLNILDWLNEHRVNETKNDVGRLSFNDVLNTLTITQDDLNVLFETDYTGGVMHVLKRHLSSSDSSPLCAFTTKENVFYVFMEKEWVLCNNEYYTKLMHLLDKQFMGAFIEWQTKNKHKGSSDDFALLYSKNMKKVMGGAFTREQLYARIKKELYTFIRGDPPAILEYDISY